MTRVLFVCLGNICRSPMAEAIFLDKVLRAGLAEKIEVDSAGTSAYHAGERADSRTIATLLTYGIPCASRARQLTSHDFVEFDHILVMDQMNLRDVLAWPGADPSRVRMVADDEVGDPYYGGPEGFDRMYHLLGSACENFLRILTAEL